MWDLLIEVGGNLLGNALSGSGSKKAANAQTDATNNVIAEQRRQFERMLQLMGPAMASENNRRSLADAFLGVPQGANPLIGGSVSTGAYNPSDWGAGRAVAGHTGGGGSNPLTAGIGSAVGSIWGPIGSAVGGAFGGLIRKGGDDWQTLGTDAPAGYAYDEYFNSSPEFAKEWAKPDVRALFNNNRDAYIWWHANGGVDPKTGQKAWTANQDWLNRGAAGVSGGGAAPGGAGGNPLTQSAAIDIWKSSPFFTAAKSGFDTDRNFLQGSAAAGGKLLSGGTLKALDDRAGARANESAGQFYNALLGTPTSATATNLGNAGMNFANNITNPLLRIGDIKGQQAENSSKDWMKTIGKIAGSVGEYGQNNGWFG